MKILLANDGSPHASAALQVVANRRWPEHSSFEVVVVADHAEGLAGKLTNVQADEIATNSSALLQRNLSDCHVQTQVLHGRASTELLREVARFEPDLLVVGSFGHTGMAKTIFGSAVDAILTHAACSVAIIRADAPAHQKNDAERISFHERKYLLCIDDSECGQRVIDAVSRRPWRSDAEFMALRVIEPPTKNFSENPHADAVAFMAQADADLDGVSLAFEKQLAPLRASLSDNSLKATLKIDSIPQDTILALAKTWGADAVIMGSHRRKGLQKLFLGSVSEAIARDSTCSVEIIR